MLTKLKNKGLELFKENLFWVTNILVFFSLLVYFFLFVYIKNFTYFPSRELLEFDAFSDIEQVGDSKSVLEFPSDSALNFKFELGPLNPHPYAGINLNLKNQNHLNVSNYNAIAIDFTPKDLDHMSLFLNVEDENVINKQHRYTTRRLLSDLFVDKDGGRQTVIIPFEKMESPNWWYEALNQSKKEFGAPNWSKLRSLSITNGINSEANKYHEFLVHRIYFLRDYTTDILTLILLQLVCTFVSALYVYIKRIQNSKQIVQKKIEINYKPVMAESQPTSDNLKFLNYIHEHFSNPELSLADIAEYAGVHPKTISDTMSEQFQCNLKTYINRIRISEAKRLLLISEFNINEIAFMVGFNSPGHFNRVFKNYTGKTPSEYTQMPVFQ